MPGGFPLITTVTGADSAPDWSVVIIPIELTFPSTAGCWGTASWTGSPTRRLAALAPSTVVSATREPWLSITMAALGGFVADVSSEGAELTSMSGLIWTLLTRPEIGAVRRSSFMLSFWDWICASTS